MVITCWYFSVA